MATQNDNKSPKELILAAKDHVEGQLLKELQCLSRDDLECYVKSRDEERAFHMMTEHLQSHGIHQFKDDDILYQCTFIGNTLHHRSRDLAAEARANLRKTSLRSFSTPTSTSKSKNGDAKDAQVPAPVSKTTASDDAATQRKSPMRAPAGEPSTVNGDETTTSEPTTDVATIHCTETCKYGRKDAVDMVRCCLCYTWFHEDCLGNYAPSSDENWWICGACRKMSQTIAGIADTVGKLYGMVETLSNDNNRLRNEVLELKK